MLYSFFVGSTTFYDAWTGTAAVEAVPYAVRNGVHTERMLATGVWDGTEEATCVYAVECADDATAQRIAYAVAVRTGNEAVLVLRATVDSDNVKAMHSTTRYRVSPVWTDEGNRTIVHAADGTRLGGGKGFRYSPDVRGGLVAYLVWADASVSQIGA